MLKLASLLILHVVCIYFLWVLWREKNKGIQRGTVFTKMGLISKRKFPRLFTFSLWIDFIILSILYGALVAYSVWLILQ